MQTLTTEKRMTLLLAATPDTLRRVDRVLTGEPTEGDRPRRPAAVINRASGAGVERKPHNGLAHAARRRFALR